MPYSMSFMGPTPCPYLSFLLEILDNFLPQPYLSVPFIDLCRLLADGYITKRIKLKGRFKPFIYRKVITEKSILASSILDEIIPSVSYNGTAVGFLIEGENVEYHTRNSSLLFTNVAEETLFSFVYERPEPYEVGTLQADASFEIYYSDLVDESVNGPRFDFNEVLDLRKALKDPAKIQILIHSLERAMLRDSVSRSVEKKVLLQKAKSIFLHLQDKKRESTDIIENILARFNDDAAKTELGRGILFLMATYELESNGWGTKERALDRLRALLDDSNETIYRDQTYYKALYIFARHFPDVARNYLATQNFSHEDQRCADLYMLFHVYSILGNWVDSGKKYFKASELLRSLTEPKLSSELRSLGRLAHYFLECNDESERLEELFSWIIKYLPECCVTVQEEILGCIGEIPIRWWPLRCTDYRRNAMLLKAYGQTHGYENPVALGKMGSLALSLKRSDRLNKLEEAKEIEVRALDIKKRVHGEDAEVTRLAECDLASTLRSQGRYKEAEELQLKLVEKEKEAQILERRHHYTLLFRMSDLANTYLCQERWKDAELLETQVFERLKNVVQGEKDPHTFDSMSRLTTIYVHQGRWKEAETLQRQAVEALENTFGENDEQTIEFRTKLRMIQQGPSLRVPSDFEYK